jgi:hypothetical protein
MPLTAKGQKILSALQKEYGAKKGKSVLYAGANKGTFTGIHDDYEEEMGSPEGLHPPIRRTRRPEDDSALDSNVPEPLIENAPSPLGYRVWLNAKDAADFRERMHKALDCMLDARAGDGREIQMTPEQKRMWEKAFNKSGRPGTLSPPPVEQVHTKIPPRHNLPPSLARDATAGSYIVSMLNTLAGTLGPMTGL